MNATSWIVDVDAQGFQRDVIERSRDLPVLVDFWATWCSPCKTLGPILAKVAGELAGRVLLAKVDIDKSPELAEAFRIQSVPAVLLVRDGRALDGFVGALSEAQVREFLAPYLDGAQPGAVEAARALEQEGRREEAIQLLRGHLREHGDDDAARVALAATLIAAERAPEARKVFERVAGEALATPEARAVRAQLDLLEGAGDLDELRGAVAERPEDVGALLALGRALVAARSTAEGLELLHQAAVRDLAFDGGAPRKALLDVFQALGPGDPLTLEYQQRLSVLLCS